MACYIAKFARGAILTTGSIVVLTETIVVFSLYKVKNNNSNNFPPATEWISGRISDELNNVDYIQPTKLSYGVEDLGRHTLLPQTINY